MPAPAKTAGRAKKGNLQFKIGLNLVLCLFTLLVSQDPVFPQSQPEDTLLFREGEILLSKGETEKALWRFKRLLTEFPKSSLLNEAKFRMGICYTQLKKPQDAIRVLNELFSTFLSPFRMAQVFTLLGDNHVELKDPLNGLYWYGKGLLIPGHPKEELKKKVRSLIDSLDTEEELTRIESLYRGAYGGGYAKFKLAQLMKRRGNELLAKKLFMEWEKEYREIDYESQAKGLSESLRLPLKSKVAIGVLLPLSGMYQPFGEIALRGIQFALKEIESSGKFPPVSLVVRDSKGNPAEAEKAVEELVTKEKVIAILGPLLTITVDKAVRKAQQMKVPLLTFSQKDTLFGKGEFVFQNSLTPSEQIQTLATYAIKELGLRTFGVFYPNSPYGLYFRSLFTQVINQKGGRVLGAVSYHEEQTDFTQEIKGFFRINTVKKEGPLRTNAEEEYKVGFSVDGLFIPDTHDRVGLILSQMAYFDVSGLTFLGTNAWNDPNLISIAGKAAEGAFFVEAFFKKSPSPLTARFVEEYQKAYQQEPETLEALTYDGTKLLLELIRTKGISSPIQMRDELSRVQNFQGVSGLKGFGEGGKTIRTLSILRVNKGQIEQVSPP